eukprot:TRINITY_DN8654_c0_g1_i1.p1 TRINITY_DN8654_c0_g1~~TRINITY_DN8654_c0_g1_i1.p1  ORF type:complete len:102 (-),score=10.15 TRINITY_DN8654_c0_g1_i1:232-537(-)
MKARNEYGWSQESEKLRAKTEQKPSKPENIKDIEIVGHRGHIRGDDTYKPERIFQKNRNYYASEESAKFMRNEVDWIKFDLKRTYDVARIRLMNYETPYGR